MLPSSLIRNSVFKISAALLVLFVLTTLIFEQALVITFLNGILVGALVAVAIAYGPLILSAIVASGERTRAAQMALGIAVLWAAYTIAVFWSVTFRGLGSPEWLRDSPVVAFNRYLGIIAAVLQITAPDFGEDLFATRDRKTLWAATIIGACCGLVAIFFQIIGWY